MENRLPGQDTPKNVVVVIDRSASMSWSEGGRSRFTAACDEGAVLLESLSSRDRANIVWIDREPDAIFPEMGSNISYLKTRLREGRSTNENGNVNQAVQLAVSLLESQPGERELHIISDFQVNQWGSFRSDVPEDIAVSTLWPVRETAENGAILSVQTVPVSPLAGETAQVIINVGNFSGVPRNQTVIVTIDEMKVTRQIKVPAWGQGSVVIEHVFPSHGAVLVSAQLEEDAFGVDDWRAVSVPVRNFLKIGVLGEDPYSTTVFQRAFHALPWVESEPLKTKIENPAAEYDLVHLAGWNGEMMDDISLFSEQGVPLLITPSVGLAYTTLADLTGAKRGAGNSAVVMETMKKPVELQINDSSHEIFTLFRDGTYGDPSQSSFNKRFRLEGAKQLGKVLLSFSDGEPALIECSGASPVMLWLAPLTPESGNWSAKMPFLPFLGEVLGSLKNTGTIQLPRTWQPGEILSFKTGATFDDAVLIDQVDRHWPVTRVDSIDDGIRFVSSPIEAPGVYRLYEKQICKGTEVVNFPAEESDLRTAPPPIISRQAVQGIQHASDLSAVREGIPLWKMLIWIALAFIGIESLLVLLLDAEEQRIANGMS